MFTSAIKSWLLSAFLICFAGFTQADDLISLFPLNNYDQTVEHWINPKDPSYDKVLMNAETQQKHLQLFYEHYVGSLSPWNKSYVESILNAPPPNDLKSNEQSAIDSFNNKDKPADQMGYSENFRPYTVGWNEKIAKNIDLSAWQLTYQSSNQAIAIENVAGRILPTEDVHFFDYHLAGQGYPFDNLQMSALWMGTPLYILATTQDKAWSLVLTPDFIAWVKSNSIARVDNTFITAWKAAAKAKLMAITQTEMPLVDEGNRFYGSAYVGMIFPAVGNKLMVPAATTNKNAVIKFIPVTSGMNSLPLPVTPHRFADLYNTLIGRPYGWGGMYLYNDCSAELKSLYTPFGIWLPRHSSAQVTLGKMVDMTAAPAPQRLSYLMANGHPFLSIVYIGGHVFQFIGNYPDPSAPNQWMAMSYQNIWGLSPVPPVRRSVIGGAVLFPIKLQYPEDPSLNSLANKKYFQVSYLDEMTSASTLLQYKIDIKALLNP